MTSENILFAIESQMYGIVCLELLLLLLQLTLSKIDLINSGPYRNWQVEITGTGSRSVVLDINGFCYFNFSIHDVGLEVFGFAHSCRLCYVMCIHHKTSRVAANTSRPGAYVIAPGKCRLI